MLMSFAHTLLGCELLCHLVNCVCNPGFVSMILCVIIMTLTRVLSGSSSISSLFHSCAQNSSLEQSRRCMAVLSWYVVSSRLALCC